MVTVGFAGPADSEIENILDDYFKIQASLAQDSTKGVDASAVSILQHVNQIDVADPEVRKLLNDLRTAAQEIQGKPLEAARTFSST